jgi:ferritin-like metal-binding protein YciE
MKEKVIELLSLFGVTDAASDPLIDFAIKLVEDTIKNKINQEVIPEGLQTVELYMIAGQYLMLKKSAGQLEDSGFQIEQAEKSIQEGDTSISFADETMTAEYLINYLMTYGQDQLNRYRKLVW